MMEIPEEDVAMDTLFFWTAFGSLAIVLAARFLVPIFAPDTLLARWLMAAIKFGEEPSDSEGDDAPRTP
jgi:hypothetical protein